MEHKVWPRPIPAASGRGIIRNCNKKMDEQGYKVKLEQFEGPLDLLLSLVEKRKLFINEISLASVADDYIAYVQNLSHFPIADSANFILVASTLVLIKSRSLLPTLTLSPEEQGSIENLENRLKLYKRMRALDSHIRERYGKIILFLPKEAPTREPVFSPHAQITVPTLLLSIRSILKNLPEKETLPAVIIASVISLEEMIERLSKRIQSTASISFREFSAAEKKNKVHVIVTFLAMLEHVKQGIIAVTQEKEFGDIQMESYDVGVPRYN